MYDTLIQGAQVFDGLDHPPDKLDIAIKDGIIRRLAKDIHSPAEQTISAQGLWVTPGFVDIHTHYDLEVEITPLLPESIRHGVTTVVMGNCSMSLTMGTPQDLADIFLRVETLPSTLVRKWLAQSVQWKQPFEYFEHLRQLPLGPNIAALLGHSALRAKVMGLMRSLHERATPKDLEHMRQLAENALDAGCIGISVDMVHWHKVSGDFSGRPLPSHHADYREYKMLADVCRERDAVFQITPNPANLLSFFNLMRLSPGLFRAPLRHTILSALDMADNQNVWRIFPVVLFIFNHLLGCNIRFQSIAEPFTIYSDGPITPLFEEFSAGVSLNSCPNRRERVRLWQNQDFRELFCREWNSTFPRTFHRNLAEMRIIDAPDPKLVGETFADVAQKKDRDPLHLFMDLLEQYDEKLRWVSTGANARSHIRHRLLSHPHILPGFSDAGAHCRNLAFFDSALSLLRQSVQSGFLSPQQAVHRVTAEPAQWFNLPTGVIREGAQADLVLLHPEKLRGAIPSPELIADPLLDGAPRMVKRDSDSPISLVLISGKAVARDGHPLEQGQKRLGQVLTFTASAKNGREALRRHRNYISPEIPDHPFTDYWDIFVLKHQHINNVRLHVLAVVMMYVIAGGAIFSHNYWLLCLMPVSQMIGLCGHWLFEPNFIDQRDAVFSFRALISLHRLFLEFLIGRYSREVERVKTQLHGYRQKGRAA